MRVAADTGGTFTDLVLEGRDGRLWLSKASTTPADPIDGVLDAVRVAAEQQKMTPEKLLAQADTFIHGTTHALNAVITGNTAKTAFITTAGHGDILVYREGGRREPFNHAASYPEPYVPRSLSFEIEERIGHDGAVVEALSEQSVLTVIEQLRDLKVEAVAVCLLWSPANNCHERRVGELLAQHMPGIPFTLSSSLTPTLREYRRASATAIDASLKPLMERYIGDLSRRLRQLGFRGSVQILTSFGGVKLAEEVAQAPIQLLQSGPSMAPIAGQFYCEDGSAQADLIITDAGGTTYDVSLVRDTEVIKTREYWIGERFFGNVTGFPSVDVRSVGAGGGSVAWVDAGGVLHVGPQSQGADPGPACYGRGGTEATVTDAAVLLGYIDPGYFLGGRQELDANAATEAIVRRVASQLKLELHEAALSIMALATENMAQAIFDLSVERGVEPSASTMVGGGGAAGFNALFIARRLGCRRVIFPPVGAVLSAAGALLSDMVGLYSKAVFTASDNFDIDLVNDVLRVLQQDCADFAARVGVLSEQSTIKYSAEARYKGQVWDIDVPLRVQQFGERRHVDAFVQDFHATHQRIFAVSDPDSPVEILTLNAEVSCCTNTSKSGEVGVKQDSNPRERAREICLPSCGPVVAAVIDFNSMTIGDLHSGPAIVESPYTSIVIDDRAAFFRDATGSLIAELQGD